MDCITLPQDDAEYLSNQLITYIGNKRKLLPFITEALIPILDDLGDKLTILDGFAGSGVVSRFFKRYSKVLHSNDLERYAYVIGQCHLANKSELPDGIEEAVDEINACKLRIDLGTGIIESLYAPRDDDNIQGGERAFYTNRNARIIDNIRRMIDCYPTDLRPFLLASLLQQASVHANTSGVFKGFYKNADNVGQFGGTARNCLARITREIELEVPLHSDYECRWHMHQRDVNELAKEIAVDVAYFDPPYNQHPYGSNYFMLNVIADYQRPTDISEVSGIPKTWNKSNYNKKQHAKQSLGHLVRDMRAKYIIVSYNNEGFLQLGDILEVLDKYGSVTVYDQDYATFRGSRNLRSRNAKVKEFLFVVEKY